MQPLARDNAESAAAATIVGQTCSNDCQSCWWCRTEGVFSSPPRRTTIIIFFDISSDRRFDSVSGSVAESKPLLPLHILPPSPHIFIFSRVCWSGRSHEQSVGVIAVYPLSSPLLSYCSHHRARITQPLKTRHGKCSKECARCYLIASFFDGLLGGHGVLAWCLISVQMSPRGMGPEAAEGPNRLLISVGIVAVLP